MSRWTIEAEGNGDGAGDDNRRSRRGSAGEDYGALMDVDEMVR
jgi:hypothetical protein